jgi:hypothetical protein
MKIGNPNHARLHPLSQAAVLDFLPTLSPSLIHPIFSNFLARADTVLAAVPPYHRSFFSRSRQQRQYPPRMCLCTVGFTGLVLHTELEWRANILYTVWPRARERMQLVKIRVLVDMVGIVVRNFFAHDTPTVHSPQTRSISGYGRRGVSPSTGGSGFRRRSGVNTIPRDVSRSVHPPVLSVQN